MKKIIETYKPEPLSGNDEDAIENILKEARKYYRKMDEISDNEWDAYKKDLKSPNYPYVQRQIMGYQMGVLSFRNKKSIITVIYTTLNVREVFNFANRLMSSRRLKLQYKPEES